MKGRRILLSHLRDRRIALLEQDGRLIDLYLDSNQPAPGTIYRATADRPIKGMGGMFVKTPQGQGFLRQAKGIAPGSSLLVQVTGYAEPGKAIPLTTRILFKSRSVIVTPDAPGVNVSRAIKDPDRRTALEHIAAQLVDPNKDGVIIRSMAARLPEEELANDVTATLAAAHAVLSDESTQPEIMLAGDDPHALAWREWEHTAEVIEGPLESDQLDALEDLKSPHCSLSGEASMYIEPTRALIAVDINTGADTSPAAGLKANLAAAKDLPRQLRLRGLGGQITLDLAPMPKKDRKTFENTLRAAFKSCPVETALVGWTPLGHYELQRKRDRVPFKM